jgi:carbohydrate kinase (thermoresistant glucokinase family)
MIYLVMGVSGVGKTTVALELASMLNVTFLDADDFHSNANVVKMRFGTPLTDSDRIPWLLKLNSRLVKSTSDKKTIVLACSALREFYRDILLNGIPNYLIIYLHTDNSLLEKRLAKRKNHFFSLTLLSSQMKLLEVPKKNCIRVNAKNDSRSIVKEIINKINLNNAADS